MQSSLSSHAPCKASSVFKNPALYRNSCALPDFLAVLCFSPETILIESLSGWSLYQCLSAFAFVSVKKNRAVLLYYSHSQL